MNAVPVPRVDLSGMVGPKRRRMRSGGNVSTLSNNSPKEMSTANTHSSIIDDEKTAQTSKCKGSTTIPIFLKKTYKMIDSSPQEIASWTTDGDMFVVKDPDQFAAQIIPQYFDHNKFSSFARQLNFYGFRKMQSKPIRNSDYDENTAKHVTFYNENFKRGRHDLLKKIQRSTRGGGNNTGQDTQREIHQLREKVFNLEQIIQDLHAQQEERFRRLEIDMLGRMEQMMMVLQQQQPQQQQQQQQNPNAHFQQLRVGNNNMVTTAPTAADAHQSSQNGHLTMNGINGTGGPLKNVMGESLDPLPYGARGASVSTLSGLAQLMGNQASIGFKNGVPGASSAGSGGPTLPPHPKQKQLPTQNLNGSMSLPLGHMDSLMSISALSRGYSNMSRGFSAESQGGNALLGNGFDDKTFSMFMNSENAKLSQGGMVGPGNFNPTPMSTQTNSNMGNNMNGTNNNMILNNGLDNTSSKGRNVPGRPGSS